MKIYQKFFIFTLFTFFSLVFVGNAKAATFSQTNVSVAVGQTSTIYAYSVITSLSLNNNSNPSVASVSILGNNINVYGINTGSTVATICDDVSVCSTIYVTVGGGNSSYGTLSLSQTSLSLTTGQTSVVTAYNNYGTSTVLYVSNNSNPSVATATVSGNTISIYGNETGSSTLTICQSYNTSCGTIYVSVSGYGYNYNNGVNNLNLSNLTIPAGSSATISSSNNLNYGNYYNGVGLYVSSNTNPNVASTNGTSSLVPGCYAGQAYSTLTGQPCLNNGIITSSSYQYIPGCYAGALYSITTGQPCSGQINNLSNNGSIVISAISPGSDTITLCQSGGSSCNNLYVTVTGGYATPLNSSYYYNPTSSYYSGQFPSTSSSGIPIVYSTSSAN